MAQRYINQAKKQVAPVYNQQIQALEGQIPQINQYYDQLTSSLQQQSQQAVNTGVQQINEDASARGVLRSTLPNDSRAALTAQLGAALQQSLGQLGLEQGRAVSGIQQQIAGVGVDRLKTMYDLADTLYNRDLQERQFNFQKQQAQQAFQLDQQRLASQRASSAEPTLTKNKRGGWEVSGGYDLAGYARATGKDLITLLLQGDKKDRQAAKWYLEKINKYGPANADKYFEELQRDRPTAFYRGG